MKTKLMVAFGGRSVEHEVAIISAVQAMNYLDKDKYDILPVYIMKDGTMLFSRDFLDINVFRRTKLEEMKKSYTNVLVPVSAAADYTIELSSDDTKYGGQGLVERMTYQTKVFDGQHFVELYLPARTAIVLKEKPHRKSKKKS